MTLAVAVQGEPRRAALRCVLMASGIVTPTNGDMMAAGPACYQCVPGRDKKGTGNAGRAQAGPDADRTRTGRGPVRRTEAALSLAAGKLARLR